MACAKVLLAVHFECGYFSLNLFFWNYSNEVKAHVEWLRRL